MNNYMIDHVTHYFYSFFAHKEGKTRSIEDFSARTRLYDNIKNDNQGRFLITIIHREIYHAIRKDL